MLLLFSENTGAYPLKLPWTHQCYGGCFSWNQHSVLNSKTDPLIYNLLIISHVVNSVYMTVFHLDSSYHRQVLVFLTYVPWSMMWPTVTCNSYHWLLAIQNLPLIIHSWIWPNCLVAVAYVDIRMLLSLCYAVDLCGPLLQVRRSRTCWKFKFLKITIWCENIEIG